MDIPGATQHRQAEKAGYLSKLSGRSFPYIPQWKRRYCVLAGGRLYYYEREDSRPGEKANGVINLEYFDQVTEAGPKDCKKATNVFIITSQDRSFFDPGRHLFSADTLPEMKDWIRRLQAALEQIRNNNRPPAAATVTATTVASATAGGAREGGGNKRRKGGEENTEAGKEEQENKESHSSTKERKKKKEDSHRSRKPIRTGVSSETQTTMTDSPEQQDGVTQTRGVPRGGVQLPGFSSHRVQQQPEGKSLPQGREGGDLPEAGPTLNCVTKQRVKGPQGRRAPQSHRRTVAALKKRASSLSALEYQDANDNSEAPWMNRSLDVLEAGKEKLWRKGAAESQAARPPLPYKAYNYSSDEEDLEDDHSDSFPASASGMPPPPPPRSASYGLDGQPTDVPLALPVHQGLHEFHKNGQGPHGNLLGSRHSLGEWHAGPAAEWTGSGTSLTQNGEVSGGASPVMDDLDNLLMNQSLQHSGAAVELPSDEASEGSTCRASQQPHHLAHQQQSQHQHHHCRKPQDLSRFAAAVRHLQRHVVDIDRTVLTMTSDVSGTKQEVDTLKEAVAALQADTLTITTTLSDLADQAITAQHKITQASQEVQRIQEVAQVALREAEQAKQEQMRAWREYEDLVVEVKSTLQKLHESQDAVQITRGTSRSAQDSKNWSKETKKGANSGKNSQNTNRKNSIGGTKTNEETGRSGMSILSSLGGSRGSGGSWTGPVSKLSTSPSQGEKSSSTYQSLFSKPSSLIQGLTSRHSLTKSVSFADDNKKRRSDGSGIENKSASLDRKKDNKSASSKDKKDSKLHSSLERKDKKQGSLERQKKEEKDKKVSGKSRERGGSVDRRQRSTSRDRQGHVISGLSDEDDIPMADDTIHEVSSLTPPGSTSGHTTAKTTFNFSLGKSSSSPTVLATSATSRPRMLPLNQGRQEFSFSSSPPESPVTSGIFPRPSSGTLPPLEESPTPSESESPGVPLFHRPGSTPGPQSRHGAMTTVPENCEITGPPTTKRSGIFAISRQNSSPNIPVQRPGSGSVYPLQRQSSLGTVPERRLPRQESLTSVPEERAVVDCTLPLSPSPSMTHVPLSPSSSRTHVPLSPSASSATVSEGKRQSVRESMELVTGPVLAGSAMQEAASTGTLPVLNLSDEDDPPAATSSLKKEHKSHMKEMGILV